MGGEILCEFLAEGMVVRLGRLLPDHAHLDFAILF